MNGFTVLFIFSLFCPAAGQNLPFYSLFRLSTLSPKPGALGKIVKKFWDPLCGYTIIEKNMYCYVV